MELLERVVGQHQRTGFFGDPQDESVAPPDGAGRWGDHLAVLDGLIESAHLGRVDPVPEGGVDHDRDIRGREAPVLLEKGPDGLVELGQAGQGSTFGGDIGPVDDDPPPFGEILFHTHSSQPSDQAHSDHPGRSLAIRPPSDARRTTGVAQP